MKRDHRKLNVAMESYIKLINEEDRRVMKYRNPGRHRNRTKWITELDKSVWRIYCIANQLQNEQRDKIEWAIRMNRYKERKHENNRENLRLLDDYWWLEWTTRWEMTFGVIE